MWRGKNQKKKNDVKNIKILWWLMKTKSGRKTASSSEYNERKTMWKNQEKKCVFFFLLDGSVIKFLDINSGTDKNMENGGKEKETHERDETRYKR